MSSNMSSQAKFATIWAATPALAAMSADCAWPFPGGGVWIFLKQLGMLCVSVLLTGHLDVI